MRPLDGMPVVTAAAMRSAEADAMQADVTVDTLMARAGAAIALATQRLASGREVLVLCGPGNNGGDGYVAATLLRAAGVVVRVAASGAPRTEPAKRARAAWGDEVADLGTVAPAPVLIDALFGTGLTRALADDIMHPLARLAAQAGLTIAIDVPSGVSTDDGRLYATPPRFDVTLALGAAKPVHLLHPAVAHCGTIRLLDIGVPVRSDIVALAPPILRAPGADAHKYSRGMVAIIAGAMPGAADLASLAAMRAGAGYALLLGDRDSRTAAIVRRNYSDEALADQRIGAIVVGPGLGRDGPAHARLAAALASGRPLVIDGDALRLTDPATLRSRGGDIILTPHAGEFDALFGTGTGSKIDRARAAALASGATIVFKGPDTVIAEPGGRVAVASGGSHWLSTAGTGDVLAGAIAAMLASGLAPFAAAGAGVWLHAEAARRCGASFVADDLAAALSPARASA